MVVSRARTRCCYLWLASVKYKHEEDADDYGSGCTVRSIPPMDLAFDSRSEVGRGTARHALADTVTCIGGD